jgi:purine-binding chemotaxis protein CheW
MPFQEKTNEGKKEAQIVVFRLGKEEFGVEINAVREISRMLEITHLPHAPAFIEGLVNLRGEIIALVDLSKRFEMSRTSRDEKMSRIIIFETKQETMGLIVDEVPEVLRVSSEKIEPPPEIIQSKIKKDYLKGIAKLGERLIVLLDLSQILAPEELSKVGNISQKEAA